MTASSRSISLRRCARRSVPRSRSWSRGTAASACPRRSGSAISIAEFEPTWFEEPTDHTKIDATAEVARRINVPVSAGESFHTTHQFAELLKYNSVHILQPDPSTMGGILRTRMVCAMADAIYAVVAPHQAQGPISTAVCVQIGACTPNLLVQELFDEFNVDWEREIVTLPCRWSMAASRSRMRRDLASTSTGPRRKTPVSGLEFPAALLTRLGAARGRPARRRRHRRAA